MSRLNKKQLKEIEDERQTIKLLEYIDTLPLYLIKAMSDAEEENIRYKVVKSINRDNLPDYTIIFTNPNTNNNESITTSSTYKWELECINELIDSARTARLESEYKYNLLQKAKKKLEESLTPEELEILKENNEIK